MGLVDELEKNTERQDSEKKRQSPIIKKEANSPEKVQKYKEIVYGQKILKGLSPLKSDFGLTKRNSPRRPIYNNLKLNNKHGKLYWEVITAIKGLGTETVKTNIRQQWNEGISNELTASSVKINSLLKPMKSIAGRNSKEILLRGQAITGLTFLSSNNLKSKRQSKQIAVFKELFNKN